MKKLLYLLLLIASTTTAQKLPPPLQDWWKPTGDQSPGAKTWVTPPTSPTFTSPQTLTAASLTIPGFVFTTDLGGKTDAIFSGTFSAGASLNAIAPAWGNYVRFQNENSSTVLGASNLTSASAFSTVNGTTTNIELWGKSQSAPLKFLSGSGMSSVLWLAKTTSEQRGSNLRFYHLATDNTGYAFLLASDATVGREYNKIFGGWSYSEGNPADYANGGEGIYDGHVNNVIRTRHSSISNFSSRNISRELIQRKWCDWCYDYNLTGVNVGQVTGSNKAGQDHGLQVEATNGGLYNFIVRNVPRPFNIFTHGYTYKNGTIIYTDATQGGYIGLASDHFAGDPRLNGQPIYLTDLTIVYDDGDANATGVAAQLCAIDETEVQIIVDNLRLVNVAKITSNDASHTNLVATHVVYETVADVQGSQYWPTFASENKSDPTYLQVTSDYHYYRGQGKGTPPTHNKFIVDAREQVDMAVNYNTAWASVSLPSTAMFLTSDGIEQPLSVTWAQGAYSSTTPGDVTVYGTPTTTAGMSDPFTIKVEKRITVGPAPTPDKHIVIDLRDNSTPPSSVTGNYNFTNYASFGTGSVPVKDENNNVLPSLRTTEGNSTGYTMAITSGSNFSAEAIGSTSTTGNTYPQAVNVSVWRNVGGSNVVRSFQFGSLDNSITYTIKVMGSTDAGVGGTHTCDFQVRGATTSGYTTQNTNGNVSVTADFNVAPSSQVIIVDTRSTAVCAVSSVEIVFTP